MKTATSNKALTNYELIQGLNKAIQDTHTINSDNVDSYFKKYEYVQPRNNNTYDDIQDFITKEYINITKGLVKALSYKCNNVSCMDIVKKGYESDPIFYDLCQEVALTLLNNIDDIVYINNKTIDLSMVIVSCLRSINNYCYRNKTRLNNTQVTLTEWNNDTQEWESIATNTRAYIEWCSNVAYNDMFVDGSIKHFTTIIRVVKSYIVHNEKPFISKKCNNVLNYLIQGYKRKDISVLTGYSLPSITKYHDIIKKAYITVYKTPQPRKRIVTETIQDNKHDSISIDFHNVHFNTNNIACIDTPSDIIINDLPTNIMIILENREHNETQAFYNALFDAIETNDSNETIAKIENREHNSKQAFYNALFGHNEYDNILLDYTMYKREWIK